MQKTLDESRELLSADAAQKARAWEIYLASEDHVHVRTDRFFAGLMVLQWIAAVVAAIVVSPRAWVGLDSYIHPHVWAAVVLGALISFVPAGVALAAPGRATTRQLIAVCQMLMSALLIHLTGGRIETHFHVFGSLAFLAFYRDWRVLISATAVVAADHLIRGFVWPESVYGTLTASPWRSFEHAGWVLFEDTFLIAAIRQSLRDMWRLALQKAALEQAHAEVEQRVLERTRELAETNEALTHEIAERARAEAEREALQRRFIETARRVGMTEIATSVLHNVGNVLTSVNVSATLALEKLRTLGVNDLRRATALVEEHRHDLAEFITADQRGRNLPDFLIALGRQMSSQEEAILAELQELTAHIEHIKGVVAVQQRHAGASGLIEDVVLSDVIEDAIRINSASIGRHGLAVVREFEPDCRASLDKHKLMQLLVNLVSNAKYALIEGRPENPTMYVRLRRGHIEGAYQIEVEDNGIGIASENLQRIFEHGFTTRSDGHGFGLHSAALAAQDLGGTLTGSSRGAGQGATFRLVLPTPCSEREDACNRAETPQSPVS